MKRRGKKKKNENLELCESVSALIHAYTHAYKKDDAITFPLSTFFDYRVRTRSYKTKNGFISDEKGEINKKTNKEKEKWLNDSFWCVRVMLLHIYRLSGREHAKAKIQIQSVCVYIGESPETRNVIGSLLTCFLSFSLSG